MQVNKCKNYAMLFRQPERRERRGDEGRLVFVLLFADELNRIIGNTISLNLLDSRIFKEEDLGSFKCWSIY